MNKFAGATSPATLSIKSFAMLKRANNESVIVGKVNDGHMNLNINEGMVRALRGVL